MSRARMQHQCLAHVRIHHTQHQRPVRASAPDALFPAHTLRMPHPHPDCVPQVAPLPSRKLHMPRQHPVPGRQ